MTVCVVGASGLVGREAVAQLCADAKVQAVHLMLRQAGDFGRSSKLTQHVIDFEQVAQADWPACDALICCLGTTIKKAGSQQAFRQVDFDFVVQSAQRARQAGASQLMVMSAMGANAGSAVFYNRVKGDMEAAVAKLGFPSLLIVRPSFLAGERIERRFGERLALSVLRFGNPLLPKKYRSVPASAVARAMVSSLHQPLAGVQAWESDKLQQFADH
jgi:uncharacterized protein YbjT (DUF2867 family)